MLAAVVYCTNKIVAVLKNNGEYVKEEFLGLDALACRPGLLLKTEFNEIKRLVLANRTNALSLLKGVVEDCDEVLRERGQAHETGGGNGQESEVGRGMMVPHELTARSKVRVWRGDGEHRRVRIRLRVRRHRRRRRARGVDDTHHSELDL